MNTSKLLLITAVLLGLAACQSAPNGTARNDIVGAWVHYDEAKEAVSAFVFKPDNTGAWIGGEKNGGPFGRSFTYTLDGPTATIAPKGVPPFNATVTNDTLQPPGTPPHHRAGDDEPQLVRDYLAYLETELLDGKAGN